MPRLRVCARNGEAREIDAPAGTALMDVLRDAGFGVEGTCGGAMSCGTCHVYVDAQWLERLAPKGEDEQAMLEAIGALAELHAGSRLSCQIQVSEALEGLSLTVAPEF